MKLLPSNAEKAHRYVKNSMRVFAVEDNKGSLSQAAHEHKASKVLRDAVVRFLPRDPVSRAAELLKLHDKIDRSTGDVVLWFDSGESYSYHNKTVGNVKSTLLKETRLCLKEARHQSEIGLEQFSASVIETIYGTNTAEQALRIRCSQAFTLLGPHPMEEE